MNLIQDLQKQEIEEIRNKEKEEEKKEDDRQEKKEVDWSSGQIYREVDLDK